MSNTRYRKKAIGTHTLHPETQMMSYGYDPHLSEGAIKPPIFLSSTFVYPTAEDGEELFHITAGRKKPAENKDTGLLYSRFNHPNLQIVEDRLALLDGTEAALATSSGMSAISSVLLTFLRPGDQMVQSSPLYGGTETLINKMLHEWQIGSETIEDALSTDSMRKALETAAARGNVGVVFIETPANPTNSLVDIQGLSTVLDAFAKQHGYRPISVCDNTLLGPVFQKPVEQGMDISVYSLTKYVGGHSDLVAGGVTGKKDLITRVRQTRSAYGMQLDPHSCWMISRSMETLVLRMTRAAQTAKTIASWLAHNPYEPVEVYHPDFLTDSRYQAVYRAQCKSAGSTFAFVLKGDRKRAFAFINALRLFKSAVSLGGTESLVCHPASTTHSGVSEEVRRKSQVSEGLIRLSIGIEHEEDLIADLTQAFEACKASSPTRIALS